MFGLLGQDENSATYALGWALAKCPALLDALVQNVGAKVPASWEDASIELQRSHETGGYTDVEIVIPNFLHAIVEAKRDWVLPGMDQLGRYRQRLRPDVFPHTAILSVSAASSEYARNRLPAHLDGVAISHRSWSEIQGMVRTSLRQTTKAEHRVWLTHLAQHLQAYVSMQNPRDNMVFVVVLSSEAIRDGETYSWVDVVEQDRRYFHPYGNHWPLIPPNYIGFRYGGKFRSLHRIVSHEVVGNLRDVDVRWPELDGREHMVYRLGPPMRPPIEITNGTIYRAAHAWCAIDTLLSGEFSTISEARDETNCRLIDTDTS